MNAWKVICATLVIFVAGIITGAALVRFSQGGAKAWRNRQPEPIINSQPGANLPNPPDRPENPNRRNGPELGNPAEKQPGPLNRQFVMGLERQLNLTPEQRDKIEKLMVEGQEHIRQMRSKIEPDIRKEMLAVNEQIKAILNPEQREQFGRLMMQRTQNRPDQPNQPERRFREPRGGQGEPRESRNQPPPLLHPPGGGDAPQNP